MKIPSAETTPNAITAHLVISEGITDGIIRDPVDQPELVDIGNGHMVFGNKDEIERYKKIRFERKTA